MDPVVLRNFVHSQDPNQGSKQAVCKVGESSLTPLWRFCNKIKTHIYIYGTFAVFLACPLVERPLSLWQKSSQLMKTWWQVFKRIFSMEKKTRTHLLTCPPLVLSSSLEVQEFNGKNENEGKQNWPQGEHPCNHVKE
jgi:hypothetical protein